MSKNTPGLKDKRESFKASHKTIAFDAIKGKTSFFSHMTRHILQGKSLERAFMHWGLQQYALAEPVIDYGSGSDKPDYYAFFNQPIEDVTLTDLYIEAKNIEKIDLEKSFALKKKYKTFVCLNVFEHIFNSQALMNSVAKHLKKSGSGIISTPYLYQYHPSPYDYWRYSPEAIAKMADKAGMKLEETIFLGKGPFVAGVAMVWNVIPKILRLCLFWFVWLLDSILLRFSSMFTQKYALGYIFLVEKK